MPGNDDAICRRCGAAITTATSRETDGVCMPCFMADDHGWRPDAWRGFVNDEELRRLWSEWRSTPIALGVEDDRLSAELISIDVDVAGCIDTFIRRGQLDAQRAEILRRRLDQLTAIITRIDGGISPNLPTKCGSALPYLQALRAIARCINTRVAPLT